MKNRNSLTCVMLGGKRQSQVPAAGVQERNGPGQVHRPLVGPEGGANKNAAGDDPEHANPTAGDQVEGAGQRFEDQGSRGEVEVGECQGIAAQDQDRHE